ncbi:ABC transporter permease [Devosia albogilva]|uniref:ABC transporter permease n=1 Tax=Devosia albogilva TaxID=429726 RepID=A0ABW5QNT8_9HYPH
MSISSIAATSNRTRRFALDKLGVLVAVLALAGAFLPFAMFRPTRIAAGEARNLFEALPGLAGWMLAGALLAATIVALLRLTALLRLVVGLTVLALLLVAIGWSASWLTPPDNTFARVGPGGGFWTWLFAFALLVTDALARMKLRPWLRIGMLVLVGAGLGLLLVSGVWQDLSILKEYGNRAQAFWQEGRTHLWLAFGSVMAAAVAGIPLGILCYRVAPLRAVVLNLLNIIQTIPSIALFGLLIAPLAWVAATVPGASAIGISGIGAAPAFVALFAYSLLPVVSNTVVGLLGVSPPAVEAAKGMGMTGWQRLTGVELPLAFPVILTGIRIVLVQNIGLATIAALIGGGGFGVFVFQGIGQTAMDLVLLGAVPTVVLAFAAAVVLDAIVDMSSRGERAA